MHRLSPTTPPIKITYTGHVDFVSPQHAFIIVEGLEKDISVPSIHLAGAMHGDKVKVCILGNSRRGRQEGKVVEILTRKHTRVVGTLIAIEGKQSFLPDHKRLHHPIRIVAPAQGKKPSLEDKVVVELIEYPTKKTQALARVVSILGPKGSHEAETNAILEEYNLSYDFPEQVQKKVATFTDQLSPKEKRARRDFTHIPTFTIDPSDAKDFDDALSIQQLDNGDYQIGIHIADVSHYVTAQSPIDQEALKRGTSVYLVGSCVPMLPERLSNDLCSLKPHVDRPAFSVVVTLNAHNQLQDLWIGETLIHSAKRFTYEEAHNCLQRGKGTFYQELSWLQKIARGLRTQRMKEGAIAFETTELAISLNDKGEPIRIKAKESYETHQLIEEFMLLANRLVAEKVYHSKKGNTSPPFIYRQHEKPSAERLETLAFQLDQLGYNFRPTAQNLSKEFNHLLTSVSGTHMQMIINTLAIRTMEQACYTTEAQGHFGLGERHYTHFTSPIRRYADLVVHRHMKAFLQGKTPLDTSSYPSIAKHISLRERVAIEAERTSISGKQVAYMKKLEGKTYKGIIASITSWGIYVQLLENKCEGMVKISDMKDDYYTLSEGKNFSLVGKNTKKVYKLGDIVRVRVHFCNVERKTIDLHMLH